MEPIPRPTDSATERPDPAIRRSFGQRLLAALKLETALYEEVEHDPQALPQAAGVVALAAVASAIASVGAFGPTALLGGLVAALLSWIVWTFIVWLVGVKLFDHASDFEELLRTLGFVAAPQVLYLLALIPFGPWQAIVGLVVLVMTLVAFVKATRQALDVSTGRALLVSALGVGVYLLIGIAFGMLIPLA